MSLHHYPSLEQNHQHGSTDARLGSIVMEPSGEVIQAYSVIPRLSVVGVQSCGLRKAAISPGHSFAIATRKRSIPLEAGQIECHRRLKQNLHFLQALISCINRSTRSIIQPDVTPGFGIPSLGLTRVLHSPPWSYEYCLQSGLASHIFWQSLNEATSACS